jgi:hypothetical protein
MPFLNPPGRINDFDRRPLLRDQFAEGWDRWLRWQIKTAKMDVEGRGGRFGSPSLNDPPPDAQPIEWDGFPRLLTQWFEPNSEPDRTRWLVADILRPSLLGFTQAGKQVVVKRRQQDEYCEWFARRNKNGGIERVDFTCEAPEYWRFLAGGTEVLFRGTEMEGTFPFGGDLSLVLELYQKYVDESIVKADLVWPFDVFDNSDGTGLAFAKGEYNPFNKWNTEKGAMHLTHAANNLGAEIQLAADGTIPRARNGTPVTDVDELVCCSGFGEPTRSSDPTIGATVNVFARTKQEVALADPVGLYIARIDKSAFFGPPGWDIDGSHAWAVDRGGGHQVLRAHFQGSEDDSVKVEQIQAQSTAITFPGQIADAIKMVLFGEAHGPIREFVDQQCTRVCCANPDGHPVKAIAGSSGQCGLVQWERVAPFTGTAVLEGVGEGAEVAAEPTVVERDTSRAG